MEQFLTNTRGKPAKRVYADGKWWLVTTAVTIPADGVLHGSRGPGLYPTEETKRSTQAWDNMPLTAYHPYDPVSGKAVNADHPGVPERQHIGVAKNSVFKGKLKHEFWLDEAKVQQVNKDIYTAALNGEPMDVSTGLTMQYKDAPAGSQINGIAYSWIGYNYKPDHIAILPTQKGACSIEHGCGMNMNADAIRNQLHTTDGLVINSFLQPVVNTKKQKPSDKADVSPEKACKILHDGSVRDHPLTDAQRGMFGAICGRANNMNFDLPPSQFVDNVWTEQARQSAALAKEAYAKARHAQEQHMTKQAGAAATGQGGKGGGKSAQYAPGQASEAAYQASMQAHQRGIASMQDLAHVEYAHQIAAYQAELAAATHHHTGDTETAQAHRKAADAHRKTAEQLRKKIDDMPKEGAGKKGKKKKAGKSMPVKNELHHRELHQQIQKACDKCHVEANPNDPYGGPVVDSVYDNHFIYRHKDKLYQQAYRVSAKDKVKFKEDPIEVERKVTYHPVTNALLTVEFAPVSKEFTGGIITTAPAANSGGSMAAVHNAAAWRQATIQFLTTNAACSCMKGKASTLNELKDKQLHDLAEEVINEFAQGSFAGAVDDAAMQRQMTQIERITSGQAPVPNPKTTTTQSTDNHPTHMNAQPKQWKTAAEWMADPASAPPEIKEMVQLSLNNAAQQKTDIIARLTAGYAEGPAKESAKAVFNKMAFPDLLALNATIPQQPQLPAGFELLRGMGHFAGAGAPIANRGQQDNTLDILPLPTHNAYDTEEREKQAWLKAKREAEQARRAQA